MVEALNQLSGQTGVWLLVGLLIGWVFRGAIKSAFEKFTGLFYNPIYQPPPLHWKGIDQNLFENPDFKIVTGGLSPSSKIDKGYTYCRCGKGRVSKRAQGINDSVYGAKGQLDPYKTGNPVIAQAVLDNADSIWGGSSKEGMCGCAVNGMYDWDDKNNLSKL